MNQTVLAILVGFVAGVAGGVLGQSLASSDRAEPAPSPGLEAGESGSLRREVAELKLLLSEGRGPTAILAGRSRALTAQAGPDFSAAAEEALLAQVDERVEAAVAKKIAELQSQAGEASGKPRKRKKREVTLAEAAVELELSGQQEDELRRLYAENERNWLALLAGPDGSAEDVKREIQEATQSPGGKVKLMEKYAPRIFKNIGAVIRLDTEHEAAIVNAVGPEKARRLEREFNVEESDALGLGGGSINISARMETEETEER